MNIADYDFVYHIFLMNYSLFNENYTYDQKKQFIHLYPGGGLSSLNYIKTVNLDVNVVSTHPSTTEELIKMNHGKFIEAKCATLMGKTDQFYQKPIKSSSDTLNICFSSLGKEEDKGANFYYETVSFFNQFPEMNIKFFGVGNVKRIQGLEKVEPMDYLTLAKFYRENIDIYINLETGKFFNGWPLGLESVINGCVLLTTDTTNVHDKYFSQNSGVFLIKKFEDIIFYIQFLYSRKQMLNHYTSILQKNLEKYITYENNQDKIFSFIRKTLYN
jgi:hypothetical protein